MKVPVVIIGAGPAGTLLSLMLGRAGIDNVVLELRSREYVVGRVRAGVLEWSTVETLRQLGVGARMDAEGHVHDLIDIAWSGHELVSIDTVARVGKEMMGYGQTELQRDLYDAADASGATIVFEATDIELHDVTSDTPVGDLSRQRRRRADRVRLHRRLRRLPRREPAQHPAAVAPSSSATTRSAGSGSCRRHRRSTSSSTPGTSAVSRLLAAQPDAEPLLRPVRRSTATSRRLAGRAVLGRAAGAPSRRHGAKDRDRPSIEKSIAPLRSFVAEPMRHGRLFLAGDAAHIVPPTGAKGLNLAVSDVCYLSRGLVEHCARRRPAPRRLLGDRVAAGVGRGALLVVDDDDAAPVPRPDRLRPPGDRARPRPPGPIDVRPGSLRRAVRRPPLRQE